MSEKVVLSEASKKKYIETCGSECPFCNYWDIVPAQLVTDGYDMVTCLIFCRKCGKRWNEEYKLVNITEEE